MGKIEMIIAFAPFFVVMAFLILLAISFITGKVLIPVGESNCHYAGPWQNPIEICEEK